MSTERNDRNDTQLAQVAEIHHLSSVLIDRLQFARQAGITFGGSRDFYEILGYDRIITNRQYRDRYARGGIAKRIVEALPNATWRGDFELIEDENPKVSTTFEEAWKSLDTKHQIKAKLSRVDRLAGLSTYAVLLIGAPGALNEELPTGKPESLLYLTPFSGGGGPGGSGTSRAIGIDADATIMEFETDPENPRFGLPKYYQLRRTDVASPMLQRAVHWTRIIHVAEGCLDDEVYGQPSLESCWNLLDDLDKVTGGGAEAFWLRANQGLQLDVNKDMALDADEKLALKNQADEYQHGIRRMFRTRGVDVNTLGSDVANFNSPADAILTQIAGTKSIPKRILTGSEMGELASSQDRDNWKDQVNGRQTGYAAPYIIRPLVDRLIKYQYLPTPAKGADAYEVKWPHIQTLTEQEKATGAKEWAATNASAGYTVFTADEIRDKWYGMEPAKPVLTEKYRVDGAEKMAATNKTQGATVFTDEEIRQTWFGWDPLSDDQKVPITAPERVSANAPTPAADLPPGTKAIPAKGAAPVKGAIDPKTGKPVRVPFARAASAESLADLHPDWQWQKEGLSRQFTFDDRRMCAAFVAMVMQDANISNHHPDIWTGPNNVTINYVTHDAGDTVTPLDYQAAARADQMALTFVTLEDHKFSSTQIQLPEPFASALLAAGEKIAESDLASGGRELDPHVTVKYGLHTNDPSGVRALLGDEPPIELWFGKTDYFETPDYDVLYVTVDSPALTRLNARITNLLDVTNTHPGYQPHATIAYLKPGLGARYADRLVFDAGQRHTTVHDVVFSAADDTRTSIHLDAANYWMTLEERMALATRREELEVITAAIEAQNFTVLERWLGGAGSGNFGHEGRPGAVGGSGSGGTFDPVKEYLTLYKQQGAGVERPTAVQAQKLHDAYTTIHSLLTDPDIGVQLWSTLSGGGSDPASLQSRIDAMRSGLSFPIIGGKGAPPKQFFRDDRNIADTVSLKPKAAGANDEKLAAALDTFSALLSDPAIAPFIAFVIEHEAQLKTAGGVGSGNFGHAGRPGAVGGSSGVSVSEMTTALNDAKTAHTAYEKQTGTPDAEWSAWYANHMATTVGVSADEIKPLLDEAAKKFTGDNWPEQYATFIVEQLRLKTAGGAGSGNFGHAGRPGEVGGSLPTGIDQATDVGAGTGGGNPVIPPFQDAGGFEHTGIVWKQPVDKNGRPIPIKVDTVEEAVALVLDGKVVEVKDAETAHTLINKLADKANEMKAAGKTAKDYDLCQVSVAGSNMFCAESLRSKDYPAGVPRLDMPQLGGKPIAGSEADKLPRNKWDTSEVDGSAQFVAYLQGIGVRTSTETIPAANLRASQRELIGSKVQKMMNDTSFDPSKNPIFISSDNYVVDGHHRWAAVLGRDAADNRLGDAMMTARRVNAPISEVLHLANAWSAKFGIQQAAGVLKQDKATGLRK